MGAWGTAIFSDDYALDIKNEYQTLLAFGTSEEEAYSLAKNHFYNECKGTDDEPVFWFSIASIQQKYGILLPEVKENAIKCIDNGSDLERWDGSELKKRNLVLSKLKEQLLAPPMPKKKVPKPYFQKPRWKLGDLVLSRLVCPENKRKRWYYNKYILYRITHIKKESVSFLKPDLAYNEYAYGALYDWIGDEAPNSLILNDLSFFKWDKDFLGDIMSDYFSYGIHLISMYWIPKNEKYTLLERSGEESLPPNDEVYLRGTGENIFWLFCRPNFSEHFMKTYEHYK